MKTIVSIICLFFCVTIFSQNKELDNKGFSNKNRNINFHGFKYKEQFYRINPKGLKSFIDNNRSDFSTKLENSLSEKYQKIKTKSLVSKVTFWSFFAAGTVVTVSDVTSANRKEDLTAFRGLGLVAIGAVVNLFLSPNKNIYSDFFNTVNKNNKTSIEFTANYNKNLNLGVAFNF